MNECLPILPKGAAERGRKDGEIVGRMNETCIALEPRHYEHLMDVIQRSMTGFHGRVFLFGSRARGNSRPTSDIDLAVSLDNAGVPLSRLRENIENSRLPFTADVVDLASCGSVLAEEVQREGVLLWNG